MMMIMITAIVPITIARLLKPRQARFGQGLQMATSQSACGVGPMPAPVATVDMSMLGFPVRRERAFMLNTALANRAQVAFQEADEEARRKWHEWEANVKKQCEFEVGERIFEFGGDWGWTPFDRSAQAQLRVIFHRMLSTQDTVSQLEEINCFGCTNKVRFDLFHVFADRFTFAPGEAIGYQLANHDVSMNSKRWIRLTTFRGV